MKKVKVFIAIPTTGNIRTELAVFLLGLDRHIYDVIISFTMSGDITNNRNKFVQGFLKTDYEWLFFVDSDTEPSVNALDMTKNGKNICSGISFQYKFGKLRNMIFKKCKGGYKFYVDDGKSDLAEIDATGAGCLLIHRRVLEKIEAPYFKFTYTKSGLTKLGEDFYFCKKAQKAGFKIWLDKRVAAGHYKTVDLRAVFSMLYKKK